MKHLKVVKNKPEPGREAPEFSGFFGPMVPLVILPFVLMVEFAGGLNHLLTATPRAEGASEKKKVRQMPARKGMKTRHKAA